MGISGVSGLSSPNYYGAISSGSRINRAADDPAGSAIHEKLKSQEGAISAGMDNIKSGEAALNIADSALAGVTDYLQSIKELSIKAANGLNTKDDKQAYQDQIDQYKQGIVDAINNAQYNTRNLVDGSFSGVNVVMNGSGSEKDISIGEASLKALGLEDYDVTGSFDMSKVDEAIEKVGKERSGIGSDTNALMSAYNYSASSLEAVNSSDARLADLDIPKAVSDMKKQQLLDDIAVQMQVRKQQDEANNAVTKLLP